MALNDAKLLDQLLLVFIEKGYASTSTRELADKCGIAEITLFRKYGTKKELFSQAVMHYLDTHSFHEFEWTDDDTLSTMLIHLLEKRYQFVLTHHAVIRMLIAETLLRNWPENFNILQLMQQRNRIIIESFAKSRHLNVDAYSLSTMMTGFIMSEIIRSQNTTYVWKLDDDLQQRIKRYVDLMV